MANLVRESFLVAIVPIIVEIIEIKLLFDMNNFNLRNYLAMVLAFLLPIMKFFCLSFLERSIFLLGSLGNRAACLGS